MDVENVERRKKIKLVASHEDGDSKYSNSLFTSTPTGLEAGSMADGFAGLLCQIQPHLSRMVQVEVMNAVQTHFHPLLESLREKKEKEKVVKESEIVKFKLVFCNEIARIIFTNNEIIGENGEPLRVAICDAVTNAIICTGLLSSAQIEFFVLDGDYESSEQEEAHRSTNDFNKNILSPRDGKRPLLVGVDQKLTLENGVGLVQVLCITDNSSWTKSKKFRMGARIRDEKILLEFPKIRVAVSRPFRVMDNRGEVNKKHHPPKREDEVWRLEGIGKDGVYHKNLFLQNIKNVGDFLEAYHKMGSTKLRMLLGVKVPKKTWNIMVENALECVTVPIHEQNSKDNCLGNKVMGADEAFIESPQLFEQKNLGFGFENPRLSFDEFFGFYFEDPTPILPGEASTSFAAASQALTPNTLKDLGSN